MEKNKTGKYFKYAIGEIVLVVVGILIALSINNWNDNRKIEEIKQNYYQQLLLDLEEDKKYAENIISVLDSSITKYSNYRKTIEQPIINFDTAFNAIFTNSFTSKNLEFKTSTINSLINTGDITLLELNLREKLSQFNASKIQALNLSKENNSGANSILQSVMISGVTALSNLQEQPELLDFLNLKKKRPELFLKLEAYFTWKNFGENVTVDRFNEIIEDIDILIDQINKELE